MGSFKEEPASFRRPGCAPSFPSTSARRPVLLGANTLPAQVHRLAFNREVTTFSFSPSMPVVKPLSTFSPMAFALGFLPSSFPVLWHCGPGP
jgi:hypothetical protein